MGWMRRTTGQTADPQTAKTQYAEYIGDAA
jgi:hypothetical protein